LGGLRSGCGGDFHDEPGGFEADAGGSFAVVEDAAEGLEGGVDQENGLFVDHPIALGEGTLEGGFEMGQVAAPVEHILAEDVGAADGAVDGAAGANDEDEFLLFGSKFEFGHKSSYSDTTVAGEHAETGRRGAVKWL